jgi:hypothetical protein
VCIGTALHWSVRPTTPLHAMLTMQHGEHYTCVRISYRLAGFKAMLQVHMIANLKMRFIYVGNKSRTFQSERMGNNNNNSARNLSQMMLWVLSQERKISYCMPFPLSLYCISKKKTKI